ncbi:hypothetical protein GOBAR_AA18882 [Gossypium barbadense]|uniref:EGF-like calcium-binding domain-containing protein n=1 Tax=Gossypium barbadense TaxID=3634 RepID=A0A2P5XEM1_GOSBA|nr:hypothetical protein GOBAR_AA18882 [Gossypium barbadense]
MDCATADGVVDNRLFSTKKISILLDDNTYLLWRQQVLLALKAHKLQGFLDSQQTPVQFIAGDNGGLRENPEFERYEQQDSALASWLLSSINPTVLPHLIGMDTSAKIWDAIIALYGTQTTSKLMFHRRSLHSQRKGDLSMKEFLMKVKSCCDALASYGEVISEREHVTAILNGLSAEYESVISIVAASQVPYTVQGVTSMLLDTENRQQVVISDVSSSANMVSHQNSETTIVDNSSVPAYKSSTSSRGRVVTIGLLLKQTFVWSTPVPLQYRGHHLLNKICSGFHQVSMPSSGVAQSQAYVATPETVADNSWYPDSGATHHLTNSITSLSDSDSHKGPVFSPSLVSSNPVSQSSAKLLVLPLKQISHATPPTTTSFHNQPTPPSPSPTSPLSLSDHQAVQQQPNPTISPNSLSPHTLTPITPTSATSSMSPTPQTLQASHSNSLNIHPMVTRSKVGTFKPKVSCNETSTPPTILLKRTNMEVLNFSLRSADYDPELEYHRVKSPVVSMNCSGRETSLGVDLTGSPFFFSEYRNKFLAAGCNSTAFLAEVDTKTLRVDQLVLGTHSLVLTLITSATLAYVVENNWASNVANWSGLQNMEAVGAVLDWAIPKEDFELSEDGREYTCREYGLELSDPNIHKSIRCFCKSGYEGNAYLPDGCQDIDECLDELKCGDATCVNKPGHYVCRRRKEKLGFFP